MKVDKAVALKAVNIAHDSLAALNDWSEEAIKECVKQGAEVGGMKGGQVMFSMRVALTGEAVTPGGAIEMAIVLGKEESLRRLKYSAQLLEKAQ